MLSGLNHLTLAVSNLDCSLDFYQRLLGAKLRARWQRGAYLDVNGLWLCLSLGPVDSMRADYTHYAFSCSGADFTTLVERLRSADVSEWQSNRSEGDSFYFLDPDGHQLEIHVGDLASRLLACRIAPYAGMVFFD